MCIDHITGFKLKTKEETSFPRENEEQRTQNNCNDDVSDDEDMTVPAPSLLTKCYMGPGHINEQRKFKRRCLGIHPFPVLFERCVKRGF